MAKVTSKGQITIPVSIRRKLSINEGDKLLFIERQDGIMMVNPNMLPVERFDDPAATQPTAEDGQIPAAKNDSASPSGNGVYAPSEKSENTNRPSSGFDVAALLNEIRSMGSKV